MRTTVTIARILLGLVLLAAGVPAGNAPSLVAVLLWMVAASKHRSSFASLPQLQHQKQALA